MTEVLKKEVLKSGPASAPALKPSMEGDFVLEGEFLLDGGRQLLNPVLHFAAYGKLNAGGDNAVLVGHALSGSALVGDWWPGLFGVSGSAGDGESPGIVALERDFVLCVNLLGSCYGSTGPGSVNAETGRAYGPSFPVVSIRDNVIAQAHLADWLGIRQFKLAIGGSIGGMQVLEWAILFPDRIAKAVVIGVAPLGAMGLAMNHLQREAITGDPDWRDGRYLADAQPWKGLALARKMAMLSYKSADLFEERFGRKPNRNGEDPWADKDAGEGLVGGRFDVAGFLDHQGERFLNRFDANSYLAILRTMDLWDPTLDLPEWRAKVSEPLIYGGFAAIQAEVIFVGISSDWLFPPADVRVLAEQVQAAGVRAEYRQMQTEHGHDAFLAEQEELVRLLNR